MAKEVGLKLKVQINGQEKVISTLNETRQALSQLEDQLGNLSRGTAEYDRVVADIRKLKTEIEDVDKATEGFGIDKKLQAVAGAANLLTGSFQTLTGIVGVLSKDEQTLQQVQEAEAQAMQVLNIALGIRAIKEGIVESKILARNATEKIGIAISNTYKKTNELVADSLTSVGIGATTASSGVKFLTNALFAVGAPLVIGGIIALVDAFLDITKNTDSSQMFADVTANPWIMFVWMAVIVLIAVIVCSMGLQNGVEKITKYMMLILYL